MTDLDGLRALAIGLIAELLTAELMVAGDVQGSTHRPWLCTTGEAIERIAREWLHSWRSEAPPPGAIVWLDNTPVGEEIGHAVLAREAST